MVIEWSIIHQFPALETTRLLPGIAATRVRNVDALRLIYCEAAAADIIDPTTDPQYFKARHRYFLHN